MPQGATAAVARAEPDEQIAEGEEREDLRVEDVLETLRDEAGLQGPFSSWRLETAAADSPVSSGSASKTQPTRPNKTSPSENRRLHDSACQL